MTPAPKVAVDWKPRSAREEDIPALEALIPVSVRALQAPYYSAAQMEAALGPVFGVDKQLIRDGTYFVVENDAQVVGCGGWSKRKSLYGGDSGRAGEDAELDPQVDPARVRASSSTLPGRVAALGGASWWHVSGRLSRQAIAALTSRRHWQGNRFTHPSVTRWSSGMTSQ